MLFRSKHETVTLIANKLDVSEEEVVNMNRRLSAPDHSLNAPLREEGEGEWQDWLVDEAPNQESRMGDSEELNQRRGLLASAMEHLTERERHILEQRRLQENPATLEDLSKEYGISRERVRQIEVRAFEKLQRAVKAGRGALPAAEAQA